MIIWQTEGWSDGSASDRRGSDVKTVAIVRSVGGQVGGQLQQSPGPRRQLEDVRWIALGRSRKQQPHLVQTGVRVELHLNHMAIRRNHRLSSFITTSLFTRGSKPTTFQQIPPTITLLISSLIGLPSWSWDWTVLIMLISLFFFFSFTYLSASLYFSKRGAYWDRLCRDVVGRWFVTCVHCGQTVHPWPIVTMEH